MGTFFTEVQLASPVHPARREIVKLLRLEAEHTSEAGCRADVSAPQGFAMTEIGFTVRRQYCHGPR